MFRNFKNKQRGQAIILIVFAIVGLIGLVGLTVDGGRAYADTRRAQGAADSAVMAAALAMTRGEDVYNAAFTTALANGYSNDMVTSVVSVNNPPTSGIFACPPPQDAVNHDNDNDGIADSEDNDDDNDGAKDSEDDDKDGDGEKDHEDEDDNNDGVKDDDDKDSDGKDDDHDSDHGTGEDHDNDHDGVKDNEDDDDDNDGAKDSEDDDKDGDGIKNDKDDDDDNDGVKDSDPDDKNNDGIKDSENDNDHDGSKDGQDDDDDNDGIKDSEDDDRDGDGKKNDKDDDDDNNGVKDNDEKDDSDHDGIDNEHDDDDDEDGIKDSEDDDKDGDGKDNEHDDDDDNDGVKDINDHGDNGDNEHDNDHDGIDDGHDDDDDNDGVKDYEDHDKDGDGEDNEHDQDNDNDGVKDTQDTNAYLCDPNYIEVKVTSYIPASFGVVLGIDQIGTTTTAIARVTPSEVKPLFDGNAIVALNPSTTNCGFDSGQSDEVDWSLLGGGIFSNGCADAKNINSVNLNGGCVTTVAGASNFSCTTPDQAQMKLNYEDIKALVPENPCDGTAGDVGIAVNYASKQDVPNPATFSNGVYCISNFDVFDGTDIVLNNATLYVTDQNFDLKFAGGGGFSGTPTNTGTYSSYYMVVQPPANQADACQSFQHGPQTIVYRGNGGGNLYGTVLAPAACIDFRGNAGAGAINSQIIGYNITSNGNASVSVEYQQDLNRREYTDPTIELVK
ncbi:MAG: hypothetical protein Fur002_13940 [Anaerolineales bacterium]